MPCVARWPFLALTIAAFLRRPSPAVHRKVPAAGRGWLRLLCRARGGGSCCCPLSPLSKRPGPTRFPDRPAHSTSKLYATHAAIMYAPPSSAVVKPWSARSSSFAACSAAALLRTARGQHWSPSLSLLSDGARHSPAQQPPASSGARSDAAARRRRPPIPSVASHWTPLSALQSKFYAEAAPRAQMPDSPPSTAGPGPLPSPFAGADIQQPTAIHNACRRLPPALRGPQPRLAALHVPISPPTTTIYKPLAPFVLRSRRPSSRCVDASLPACRPLASPRR